jgi:WhiB family transcriptional regulator, redox-sensing transcriptional regulator
VSVIAPGDWWEFAACQTTDPDLFFPISATGRAKIDVARARAVCQHCQVRARCLDYALATRQVHGIWGGLTEDERRPLFTSAAAQ